MDGNSGYPAVRMPELLVRSPVTDLGKSETLKAGDHFSRLESRNGRHKRLGDEDRLGTYKFAVELWVPIFEQHLNDLMQVRLKFFGRSPLTMSPGKTWDIADVDPGLRVTLHNGGKGAHFHSSRF